MKTFKCLADVDNARLQPPIKMAVQQCMQSVLDAYGAAYDPDNDGWVILVEQTTSDIEIQELFGAPLQDISLEGVTYDSRSKCFLTLNLSNNQFGITIVIPDQPWIPKELRNRLMYELNGT